MEKIKKVLSLLLTAVLLMTAVPFPAVYAKNTDIFWSTSFEEAAQRNWSFIDKDGDGKNWYYSDSSSFYKAKDKKYALVSISERNNPDEYAVSPVISVPSLGDFDKIELRWYASPQGAGYCENYSVYVYTGSTALTKANAESLLTNPDCTDIFKSDCSGEYEFRSMDMTKYAGKNVRIVFRHYNSADLNALLIDDISMVRMHSDTQTLFENGFETENEKSQWTVFDCDKDGNKWRFGNVQPYEGNGCMYSDSYLISALHPDNFAVSEAISIPAGMSDIELRWYAGAYDSNYYKEHYSVYIYDGAASLTASNIVSLCTSPVFSETLTVSDYRLLSVDLPTEKYSGKTVKIIFRHHNCTDQSTLMIDNVSVTGVPVKENSTVTYDANGGSGAPAEQTKIYGTALTLSTSVPSKTGYKFTGWNTEKNGSGTNYSAGGSYTAEKNVTLYACWSAISYSISYSGVNGATNPNAKTSYTIESSSYTFSNASKTGYTFGGWELSGASFAPGSVVKGTQSNPAKIAAGSYGNVTAAAKWTANEYTVSFEANGGSCTTPEIKVTFGKTYGALPVPSREGYQFAGWFTSKSGGSKVTKDTVVSSARAHTLYAQWSKCYKVTYNANIGSISVNGLPEAQIKQPGETIELNADAEKISCNGYTFKGWFDETGKEYHAGDEYSADKDLVLYAQWEIDTYTVSYNSNVADEDIIVPKNQIKTFAVPLTLSSDEPVREGYYFTEWNTSEGGNGTGYKAGSVYKANSDAVLYAQWAEKEYTVSYNANCTDVLEGFPDNQTKKHGFQLTLSSNKSVREGYEFAGWNTLPDGTGEEYHAGEEYSANKDLVLYAQWKIGTYTVTFDTAGGSYTTPEIKVTFGKTYGALPVPSREGYQFAGWYDESGTLVTGSSICKSSKPKLTAHWDCVITSVTVDFAANTVPSVSNINGVTTDAADIAEICSAQYSNGIVTLTFKTGYTASVDIAVTANNTINGNLYSKTIIGVEADGPRMLKFPVHFISSLSVNVSGYNVNGIPSVAVTPYDESGKSLADYADIYYSGIHTGVDSCGWYKNKEKIDDETSISIGTNYAYANGQPIAEDAYYRFRFDIVTGENCFLNGNIPVNVLSCNYYKTQKGNDKGNFALYFAPVKESFNGKDSAMVDTVNFIITPPAEDAEPSAVTVTYGENDELASYASDVGFWKKVTTDAVTGKEVLEDVTKFEKGGVYRLTVSDCELPEGFSFAENVKFLVNGHNTGSFVKNGNSYSFTYDYELADYKLIFSADGADCSVAEKNVYQGEAYGALPVPVKDGFVFEGWFTAAKDGDMVSKDSIVVPADFEKAEGIGKLTLYAHWSANSNIVVSFYGCEDVDSIKVTFREPYGELPSVKKTGYIFGGWFTSPDGENKVTADTTVSIKENHILYARWIPISYTVSYNLNGGLNGLTETAPASQSGLLYGVGYTISAADPTRAGYQFDGWKLNDINKGKHGSEFMNLTCENEAEITLVADWIPNKYTVSFDAEGGSCGTSAKTVDFNSAYGDLPEAVKEGYKFAGWFMTDGTEVTKNTVVSVANNHILYAKWNENVITVTVRKDDSNWAASGKNILIRTADGTVDFYAPGSVSNGVYTYNAVPERKYEVVVNNENIGIYIEAAAGETVNVNVDYYTVSLYKDAGISGVTGAGTYLKGSEAVISATVLNGYTWDCWSDSDKTQTERNIVVDSKKELTAKTSLNSYSITYNLDGGTNDPENPESYSVTTDTFSLNDAAKTGYTFVGWYDAKTNGKKIESIEKGSTGDITLYARFSANSYKLKVYAVYNTADSAELRSVSDTENVGSVKINNTAAGAESCQDTEYNTTATITATSGNYYQFDGWYLDSDCLSSYSTTAKIITANMGTDGLTYYAKFIPKIYLISIEGSQAGTASGWTEEPGGAICNTEITASPTKIKACYGSEITLSKPSQVGYTFNGWGNAVQDGDNYVVSVDKAKTVTAIWSPNKYILKYNGNGNTSGSFAQTEKTYDSKVRTAAAPGKEYTVTFDSNGGSNVNALTAAYTFNGWKSNRNDKIYNANVEFTDSFGVGDNSDVTLTAQWKETDVSVALTNPSRKGYTFTGWKLTSGNTEEVSVNGIYPASATVCTPKSNITLTAQWKVNTYKLTFNPDGGSCEVKERTIAFDSAYGTLPTSVKTGYVFDGWFTSDGKAVTSNTVCSIASDHSLTARWKLKSVSIRNFTHSRKEEYKTSLTFHAQYSEIPEGSNFVWYVNNSKETTGDTLKINRATSSYELQLKLETKSGSVLWESEVEQVNIKSSFFNKIVAFFRSIFSGYPDYEQ